MATTAALAPGRATEAGTRRFAERFAQLPGHFRRPDRLTVSSLALGMRSGEPGGLDDLLYREAVPRLLAGGVNVFVTGLSERAQTSERALGIALERALREGVARRDEIMVVTRGGFLVPEPEHLRSNAHARRHLRETYLDTGLIDPETLAGGMHSLEPAFLRDQIERSRRNLRLETLDLYLIEEPELHLREGGPDEFRRRLRAAFEALERAVGDGAIGGYGIATWDGLLLPPSDRGHLSVLDVFSWALEAAGGAPHLCALQLPYGIAMGEALCSPTQLGPAGGTESVLRALEGTGTLVLASAPLAHGRALGRLPDFVREAFPRLRSDAARCLQFARSTPGIATAVVGMREPEHLDANLGLLAEPPAEPESIEKLFALAAAVAVGRREEIAR